MVAAPVIGILLDWEEKGSFAPRPYYALRQAYFDAITETGGIPVGIGYDRVHMDRYLELIDGLLLPGGNYKTPDEWYIDGPKSPYPMSPRAVYEVDFIKRALEAGKPVLAICGGMQVMGCAFGAKLTGDLHAYYKTPINHKNGIPAENFAYRVTVTPETKLAELAKTPEIRVNTAHCEALVTLTDDIVLSGLSEDNTVQAIEIKGYNFAIGVQWHPEFFVRDNKGEPVHRRLFETLVKNAA